MLGPLGRSQLPGWMQVTRLADVDFSGSKPLDNDDTIDYTLGISMYTNQTMLIQ